MLAAILDFSVRHHLCQFMPAVSETTENVEHFGIWHILLYGGGVRVHIFSVLKVTLPFRMSHRATSVDDVSTISRAVISSLMASCYAKKQVTRISGHE